MEIKLASGDTYLEKPWKWTLIFGEFKLFGATVAQLEAEARRTVHYATP